MRSRIPAFRIIACFLAVICLTAQAAFPAFAEENGRQTVKVAVLNHSIYANQDASGAWSGLDVECMISIAQKAGFDLQFIDSATDPDYLGGLDDGRYDIVADVVETPERARQYLFTEEAIGSTSCTMAVRADDDRWDYGNIEQISRMRVGVIASYANNAAFRAWCAEHDVAPVITEYRDIEQMTAALLDRQIDAEVYTAAYSAGDSAGLRTVMKLLPESFYYAFRLDNTALKNKVDDALAQLLATNPNFLTDMKNKYEEAFSANDLPFSAAEKEYIAAHPQLTVAMIKGDAPYYVENADGSAGGIFPDYYALVAENTGFRFRYAVYDTQQDAIAAVKNGEADILGVYSSGLISSQKDGLVLTDSIAALNSILLTKSGSGSTQIKSIAVKLRALGSLSASLAQTFPDAELKEYENAEACRRALERGEVSAMLIGLPSATWIINQTNSGIYDIRPVAGAVSNMCGAVSSGNLILCSILNKRIAITRISFSGIVTKDTLPKNDLRTMIARVPPTWTILIFSVLLCLILFLVWTMILLRRRQKERTAVLTAQAETARQKLQVETIEKNAEERNRFFANISHDMRTPLNAVIGFSNLAESEEAPGRKNEYIAKIRIAGQLLNSLIDDTLTLSKASSGKFVLHPEEVSTEKVGKAIVETIRFAAEKKNIALSVDKSGYRPRVIFADALNLQKLFLNILSNAVKYTPPGGHVWVGIWDEPGDSGDPTLCFSIRDDGIGISAEFLPHIFEPFSQEKRPGYESVGTGLGLSIVKQLVDLMGGTIEVRSEINKGTEFIVRLQFREASGGSAKTEETAALSAADLNGRRILLCEDNELNREIAVTLLTKHGMTVETAANGQEGVRMFLASAQGTFDAILMDLRMPVMDGITAAKTIRALDRTDAGTVPILAMTADAFSDDVQKCLDAGMNGHLAKPIDPKKLFQTLLRCMTEN